MKHIIKGAPPQELVDLKRRKAPAMAMRAPTAEEVHRWLRHSKTRRALKQALLDEQGHLCCYCERRIGDSDDADGCHIEHLRPVSAFPEKGLEYDNLLLSCMKDTRADEPKRCGHLKDEWHDDAMFVSPLDADCEEQFVYDGDGFIAPANESAASQETIKRLNLNYGNLVEARKNAIEMFVDVMVDPEFGRFVYSYLHDKRFNPFWTTIHYLFGAHAETVHAV